MDPPCHLVTKTILPYIKRDIARQMYETGLSQADISRKLAVSQAMVSKYLDSDDVVPLPEEIRAEVDRLKAELAALLETDAPRSDTVLALCQGCFRIRESGHLCTIHDIENCNACTRLRYQDLTEDKRAVVEDIREALKLMESKDVSPLAPQVSMNIARASAKAGTKMDVASIPGRISFVRGKPRTGFLPEFGASSHLSELLLSIVGPGPRAVINIKLDKNVERAVKKAGFKTLTLDRKKQDLFKLTADLNGSDIIFDHGDFGIEPCTYVFGQNAVDSARKVIGLMEEFNNGE